MLMCVEIALQDISVRILKSQMFAVRYVQILSFKLDYCVFLFVYMCLLSPDSGPWINNTYIWYYNNSVGRCQQFTCGGCGGR